MEQNVKGKKSNNGELPCAKSTGRRDAPPKNYGDSSLRQRPQGVLAFNINIPINKAVNSAKENQIVKTCVCVNLGYGYLKASSVN
jgi:hypothetical protein